LCAFGVYHAHYNLMNYYAFPQTLEVRYIKSALRQADLSRIERIHIVRPEPELEVSFVAPKPRGDEFASAATVFKNDVPWIVKCVLIELGLEQEHLKICDGEVLYNNIKISSSNKDNIPEFSERTVLIDMTRLQKFY
ncbi:MAG: hypothetical protein KAU28_09410, partial [Phycisphaerae bacterium]|nr:hypothetical protein [Phycisphaerae bacterium]